MLEFIPLGFASLGLSGLGAGLWLMRGTVERSWSKPPPYVPRHRAPEGQPSTAQLVADARRSRIEAESAELLHGLADGSGDQKELDRPGPLKGSYAHLRTEELDSTAERFWRLVEKGIRPPSPWGTPSTVDEWDPMPEGVDGYAIAGRTR